MLRPPTPLLRRRSSRAVAGLVAALLLVPTAAVASNDPARDRQWGLDVIGAETAWVKGRGAGITIAIVDSGVDLQHEDLVGRLVPGFDVIDRDGTPQDEFGHGTHVAGIAAATADNGRGIAGVAPLASIMPVRVLDEDGSGASSGVTEGVRWAVDNGADVINLSLGQTAQGVFGSSLVDAIRYAWDNGVVVVVAAGNDYVLTSGFDDEPALVVSATTVTDREPDYSSGVGGAKWGIAAPGGGCQLLSCAQADDVFSTYWDGGPNRYAWLAGTSMAAPHVAGAAAILLGLGLTPQQTVDRLLATAKDIGASGRDNTFGAGRLDLAAATAGLGVAQPDPVPAPTTKPDPKPVPVPDPTDPPANGSGASSGGGSQPAPTDSSGGDPTTPPSAGAGAGSGDGADGGDVAPGGDGQPQPTASASTNPASTDEATASPSDVGPTPESALDDGGDLTAGDEGSSSSGVLPWIALVLLGGAAAWATIEQRRAA